MSHLVIFDFDGTLVDTLTDIVAAVNAARADIGASSVTPDTMRSWIGQGFEHLIRQALPEDKRNAAAHSDMARRYHGHYERLMFASSAPYPGVIDMLDALGHCQLAVCSNKVEPVVRRMLTHFGMHERFFDVIGGDTLHVRKPDPRVITHLIERAKPVAGHVWMVGDSDVDVTTGKGAGVRTIGCAYGIRGRTDFEHDPPDFIVDDATAIADVVLACGR